MPTSYLLDSLSRAIQVAAHLQSIHPESVSLIELGRQTGVNKTTVLRILRTLEHHGWVSQPAPGRYRAAVRFSDNRSHRIGYSSRDNSLPFPHAVTDSLARCAATHGVELLSFDNRGSRAKTIRNAQRMIREKVDVAVVFQAESATGPQLSSLFNESGTPMISIDMAVAGASYFGADNYSAGLTAGRTMARSLQESGAAPLAELILLGNSQFGSLPAARLQGFATSFQKHHRPSAGLSLTTLDSRGSFEAGLRRLRAQMGGKRGRGVVVAVSDPIAMGAVQAIEEAGRASDWMVWSFGGGPDIRLELRRPGSPLFGAMAFSPENYGDQIWSLVVRLFEKRPVPPAIFAKMRVMTRANIDTIYPLDAALQTPAVASRF